MKIKIRAAMPSDSDELILLTRQTPMDGGISIRIDRDPDFFSLSKARGETEVFVAYNGTDNLIVGCFSFSKQLFYSFGEPVAVYYLADLKIRPSYSKSVVAYLLTKHILIHLRLKDADIGFFTAENDNFAVRPFFDGRASLPKFQKLTTFNSYQILPRRGKKSVPVDVHGLSLVDFYEQYYKDYSFYPSFTDLDNCKHFVNIENCKITCSISVVDPFALKKNVVVKVRPAIRLLLTILRLLKCLLPMSSIPALNKPLNILFIRYYAFQKGGEDQFMELLEQVRDYAFANEYHLLSVTVDEKNTVINRRLKNKSILRFVSIGLVTSLNAQQVLLDKYSEGLCYADFSLS
jgi:hypothetical protein